jgi:hypothetical protein
MAKIIYKEGLEGQNKLECIEGIEIELLNGQKALIYPKYAERPLLEREKISKWGAPEETEIEALKVEDTYSRTVALLNADSPAAEWISQFGSDRYEIFYLPSLLAAMEIQHQKNDIDELAETIEGADLLRDFTSYVWSCSRYYESSGWIAYGYYGFASFSDLCFSYLAVPLVLYR